MLTIPHCRQRPPLPHPARRTYSHAAAASPCTTGATTTTKEAPTGATTATNEALAGAASAPGEALGPGMAVPRRRSRGERKKGDRRQGGTSAGQGREATTGEEVGHQVRRHGRGRGGAATSEEEQGDPSVGGEQGHILPHSSDPWIELSPREKSIALKALIFFFFCS
jgi:hypothetical protein